MAKLTPLDTSSPVHGDEELAKGFLDTLGKRRVYGLVIVSVSSGGATRFATVGAEHDSRFELGSIGKAVNGQILASLIADGTVTPAQELGSLLPLGDSPASAVTLESLATHTSGLPAQGASGPATWRKSLRIARGREADTENVEEFLGQLRGASLRGEGYRYSNLGGAALGHALAAAVSLEYPELIRERFAGPLGLPTADVLSPGDAPGARDVSGATFSGREAEPWTAPGYAPAGGIRASADDMTRYLESLLSGTSPGMEALDPWVRVDDGLSMGAGWHISHGEGRTITWLGGETSGFSAWLGIERGSGSALMIGCSGHIDLDGTAAAMLLSR